jgi:flagellar hook-associated protein 1 FlgK
MSLNAILNSATSGLQTNQTALKITSNNIANVNTEGYHRRVADLGPRLTGGVLTGVRIDEVRRIADNFLAREATAALGQLGSAEVLAAYFERVQDLIGSLDANSSLDARISSAMTALTQLAVDPSSAPRRNSAIASLTAALNAISGMASNIQGLRQDANAQIVADVSRVNELIARIYELNKSIKVAVAMGDTATGLLDQRDNAVAELAKFVDIRTQEQTDGRVFVSLGDGTSLITDVSSELRYLGPTAVTAGTSFPPLELQRVDPESGNDIGQPTALEGRIRGGEMRGLIDMRDKALPDLAEQLGVVGAAFSDQLNAIHNDSAAVPAPASLTGRNTGLLAGDALNFTGNATIAIVDAQGALLQRLDLNLAGIATVGDLVTAINGGLGGAGTASFTNGVLTISAAGGNGVALLQDPAAPSARGGRGLSHFFGLNDLVTAASPSSFATGVAAGDAHGFTAAGVAEFVLRGSNGAILSTFNITVGGASFADIVTSLNTAAAGQATFALDASGNLTMTPTSPGARLEVKNDTTARGATGVTLSQFFGMGTAARQNQAASLGVRSDIAADSSKMALAQLDLSATTVIGDTVLGVSDNRGALLLAAIGNATVAWPATGGLASGTMTLGDYVAQIMGAQSDLKNAADSERLFRSDISEEVAERRASIEGVNMDEELAAMMVFQQAYNASARLMTTVQQMYDTLLSVV